MMVLTIRPATDGAVFVLGGLLPVSRTVTATTIASDTSHPKMNAAPFRTPPCDANTRMNAVKGIGSRVIANPMRTRLRTSTRMNSRGVIVADSNTHTPEARIRNTATSTTRRTRRTQSVGA